MVEILFWASIGLIVYHHIGYPIALRTVARWLGRRAPAPPKIPVDPPSVTLIVPAHNEEAVIAAKLRNLAALEYPRSRLIVVLVLDGCSDGTARIVRDLKHDVADLDLRVVEHTTNKGKLSILNEQVSAASTEIVALSDTSAILEPQALLLAVRHFASSSVGVVCPAYGLLHPGSEGERAYWDYQRQVKNAEGVVGAPMGAHGAFYLFRRDLWEPLEPSTINDDFILPMRIVQQGYDAVYDSGIVAMELEQSTARQDFRRRIRIGAGNLQQVLRLARLADPRRPGIAFVFLSGKALRAFVPLLLLIVAITLPILAFREGGIYRYALLGEFAALVIVLIGLFGPVQKVPRQALWAAYFVKGHAAGFIGALVLLFGRREKAWKLSSAAKAKA